MGIPRLDVGAGVGQPSRADFLAEGHQERLRARKTEIGSVATPRTGQRVIDDPWGRQDRVLDGAYDATDQARSWQTKVGQKRSETRAVTIDKPPERLAPKTEGRADPWEMLAAEFEEWAQENGEKLGLNTEKKLPAVVGRSA